MKAPFGRLRGRGSVGSRSGRRQAALGAVVLTLVVGSAGGPATSAEAVYALAFTSIATSLTSTCAITTRGTLWCWGANDHGQLGTGDKTLRLRATQEATGRTDWAAVGMGDSHTCALTSRGQLYCWGFNGLGALGLGDTVDRVVPTAVPGRASWSQLVVGAMNTCASGLCWGSNVYGQLGVAAGGPRTTPTPIPTVPGITWASGRGELSVGAGRVCAISTTQRLFCWGVNWGGELGIPPWSSGNYYQTTPAEVGGSDWARVSTGERHTCGLKVTGELFCWGTNYHGELGLGAHLGGSWMPRLVTTEPFAQVSAGQDSTCATAYRRSSWHTLCWGYNADGRLGLGDTVDRWTPIDVGPSSGIMTTTWGGHTCDITGAVWCWGANSSGELGDGTTTNRLRPVRSFELL